MVNETLARRYAAAIFELAAEANVTGPVGRDLAEMSRAIFDDPATREFFVSPVVDRSDKERALSGAFQPRVNAIALHALLLIVRKRREAILTAVAEEYRKLELQSRGAEPLTVTTATPLADAELRALVDRLERAYGKKFEVTVRDDPRLIGGLRVTMGDRRIDGSVAGRLEQLSRTLFATN